MTQALNSDDIETQITMPEPCVTPARNPTTTSTKSTTNLINTEPDRFSFLGNARTLTLVVCGITLLGILAFLTIPLKSDPILFYVMKSYYTLAAAMIVFGTVAIVRYSPISITIYTVFYIITALLSSAASMNSIREQVITLQSEILDSKTKTILLLIFQSIQVVYWIGSSIITIRFYNCFRVKYLKWKGMNNLHPDGHFQHWCFQNHIDSQDKSTRNAILDSM